MSSIRSKSAKPIRAKSTKDCPSTKPLFNTETGNCIADTWNNRQRLGITKPLSHAKCEAHKSQKKSSSSRGKSSSSSTTITSRRAGHTQSKKSKPLQEQNQKTPKILISERRAKAIAKAIHSNGNDDEAVDTFENLANETFTSVHAIVNKIINLDKQRFAQGWGKGDLQRKTVADAVVYVLGA